MLRFYIALLLAKLSIPVLKITGHNATDFPGTLALKICPDFVARVGKPSTIYVVTGTNGKTTTSNMINDALRVLGKNVLNNSAGSNIESGIATVLLKGAGISNRSRYDTAVLEVDERSAKKIFPYCHPDVMIVTNLARDSIMRNAHPEYIRWFLEKNTPADTDVILCADDMVSCNMLPNNRRVYYGAGMIPGDHKTDDINIINDMKICPECHSLLEYDYYRYSNTGKAHCPCCGYSSPACDFTAEDVDFEKGTMTLCTADGRYEFPLLSDNIYNLYNEMSAAVFLMHIGNSVSDVKKALSSIGVTGSRYYHTRIGDMDMYRLFCKEKNSYAASRVFQYLSGIPGKKEIVLYNNCVGDTKHWSENICWMFDADFEFLAGDDIERVVVYGDRRYDYRFRMRLAGVPEQKIVTCEDPYEVTDRLGFFEGDNIYVLYGTDSLALGLETAKRIEERAEEEFRKRKAGEK